VTASLVDRLADLPKAVADALIRAVALNEAQAFEYDWRYRARPEQLAPEGSWRTWLLMAGRGFGKTRCGAEWVRGAVQAGHRRIALIAPTAADVRDVMVEGESGILAIHPDEERPLYEPSKRRLTWPKDAQATTYSADEPERLRGPQHDAAWCDEVGAWRYPEAWDMLMFGMRLGRDPRTVVTTTTRPTKLIRELVRDPTCIVTRGSSYENRGNLAPAFFQQIVRKYEGTRLGRQELEAELLEDTPGALWNHGLIEAGRLRTPPELVRVVVAIDPAVTSGEESDETGIVVVGRDGKGHGYVLADCSGRYAPNEWAKIAITAYKTHGADRIVAEVNNGGDMVEATIRMIDPNVAFKEVHASRGKVVRAEPVAALYEQGRAHHIGGFGPLEDQMTNFTSDFDRDAAGYSPDRVDALVWAFTELLDVKQAAEDYHDASTPSGPALVEGSSSIRSRSEFQPRYRS
jgi:phage terminase large subunit-like protein